MFLNTSHFSNIINNILNYYIEYCFNKPIYDDKEYNNIKILISKKVKYNIKLLKMYFKLLYIIYLWRFR